LPGAENLAAASGEKREPLAIDSGVIDHVQNSTVTIEFSCDCSKPAYRLPHVWERIVGSGHALLALRADWQRDLLQCRRDLGFEYVRFHSILCDDLGTLTDQNHQLLYSFHNADQIFDFLVANKMKPFVELSFMPLALSSGDTIVFHYKANVTPPRDYGAWATLIAKLVGHWSERYGKEEVRSWFFEVWNEPNLPAFWTGSQADYFHLYRVTADAIKGIDSEFKIGGPASANNAWAPEFIEFCNANRVARDFISTHHYPTDAFGKPGDDTLTELSESRIGVLRDDLVKLRKQAGRSPVYYTEWSTSSNARDALHDESYAAAYVTHTNMGLGELIEGYSYWTFSDIFEENYFPSIPFHGGFGLMNIHGVPKPSYRAFELLHRLGEDGFDVVGAHETVSAWVVGGPNVTTVLLTNLALPRHRIERCTVRIGLTGLRDFASVAGASIDDRNANAKAAWRDLGAPDYPSPTQIKSLIEASRLVWRDMKVDLHAGIASVTVSVAPQSVTAIEFVHGERAEPFG
jgi:xylan 1,4-beta-xylosidase